MFNLTIDDIFNVPCSGFDNINNFSDLNVLRINVLSLGKQQGLINVCINDSIVVQCTKLVVMLVFCLFLINLSWLIIL